MYVILHFSKTKAHDASISSGSQSVKPPKDPYSEFCENLSVFSGQFGIFLLPVCKAVFKLSVYMVLVVLLLLFYIKAFLFLLTLKIKCSRKILILLPEYYYQWDFFFFLIFFFSCTYSFSLMALADLNSFSLEFCLSESAMFSYISHF